jgi:tRNA 2-selenouridine synthase
MQQLAIDNWIDQPADNQIIDVRSEGEFAKGHIPGACNIPVLTNSERAAVGKLYKQNGADKAEGLGHTLVDPRKAIIVKHVSMLSTNKRPRLYCWRGGLRSQKMAALLSENGFSPQILRGGYKSYRQTVSHFFAQPLPLLVLEGNTGSGKSEILRHLAAAQEQVIDLEAEAKHRGSAFGHLGEKQQPTTSQMHNNLYQKMSGFTLSRRIWIEGESLRIGKITLPEGLWENMNRAPRIEIEANKERRIERIISEYGDFPQDDLLRATQMLRQRLGNERLQKISAAIRAGELGNAVEILLEYYDRGYSLSRDRHRNGPIRTFPLRPISIAAQIDDLLRTANTIESSL